MKFYSLLTCTALLSEQVFSVNVRTNNTDNSLLAAKSAFLHQADLWGTEEPYDLPIGHPDRPKATPAECAELKKTIEDMTHNFAKSPSSRRVSVGLSQAKSEYAEVCAHTVDCPIFTWETLQFDVLVFDYFKAPSSKIEGMLMVGGNVKLSGYDVGVKYTDGNAAMVIGGDINWDTGRLAHGNLVYGGENKIQQVVMQGMANGQQVWRQPNAVNFIEAEKFFLYVMNFIGRLYDTYSSGNNLVGPLHTMSCKTLGKIRVLNIADVTGATVNVIGETCELTDLQINSKADCSLNLFNFPTATSLTIKNCAIPGTVHAPAADVKGVSGSITGTAVFKSFQGTTMFNKCRCKACPHKP